MFDEGSTKISSHSRRKGPNTAFSQIGRMVSLGQYAKGFFVTILDDKLYLLDQHAAS
jgi:DNA mismatch repair ATPase MutL